MEAIDVLYAYTECKKIVKSLTKMRDNSEKEFKAIFEETTKLGKSIHGNSFVLKKPRTTGRQAHRSNIETNTVEEYFRITLYNEFLYRSDW